MFTDTELKIMDLIYKGLLQQEIANKIYLSKSTVCTHTNNIYRKCDVHNINQFMARHIKELEKQIQRLKTNVKQLEPYKQKWEYLRDKDMENRK